MKAALALLLVLASGSASAGSAWDNLLGALYLEGGGAFEWAQDLKDGYPGLHLEPRYSAGAGFSFDTSDSLECDIGYRWQDMPPIPGRVHDALDKSHAIYVAFRFRPFRRE